MSASDGHEKDLVNTAVFVFAHYLGIDLERDQDLIWIAEEAFEKLPEGWEFGVSEEGDHAGIPYFYNSITGESVWNHPDEDKYKRKLKRERQLKKDNSRSNRRSSLGRDNSGSTVSSSPVPTDRSQASTSKPPQTRAVKELTMVEEVVDFEQDEIPPVEPVKSSTAANSKSKPAFGLSEDDFFDARAGGPSSVNGRDYSPPLFKDLKLDSGTNNTRNTNTASTQQQQQQAGSSASNTTTGARSNSSASAQQGQGVGGGGGQGGQQQGDCWFRVPGDTNTQSSQQQQSTSQQKRGGGGLLVDSDYPSSRRGDTNSNTAWDNNSNSNNNRTTNNNSNNNRNRNDSNRDYRDNTSNSRSSPVRSSQPSQQQSQSQSQSQQVVSVIDESALYQAQQAANQILTQQQQSLTQQVSLLQTQHTQNLQNLRDDLRLTEQRLNEEKLARSSLETHLQRAQSDLLRIQRESDEGNELKLRETLRKVKADLEDEFRERIRTIERKSIEDLDSARQEISSYKRKFDDALREMDLLKRRNLQSKDEGRMDAENEILALKQSLRDLDEENNRLKVEIKRHKEEISLQLSRVAANQLVTQQQAMELESLRLSQQQAIHESQIQAASFMQASQRLAMNESEFATYKAENTTLRTKNDQLEIELKRLRGTSSVNNETLIANEAEMKRSKLLLQQEIQRISAKLAESEAVSRLLRDENSKFQHDETQALRTLRNQYETVENEKSRVLDSLTTCKLTIDELQTRLRKMETDTVLTQEQIYRKDRALREETQRLETLQNSILQIRTDYETTISTLKQQVTQLEEKLQQGERKYQEKVNEIQLEVSDRLPRLVSQAVEQNQHILQTQHNHTLHEQRLQYESVLAKKRRELLESQADAAEQLVKERLRSVEDRAELDRLRVKVSTMQQQMVEMENVIAQHKQQLSFTTTAGSNSSHSNTLVTHQTQQQQQQLTMQQRSQPQQSSQQQSHQSASNNMSMSRLYDESLFDFSSLLPAPPTSHQQQQQQQHQHQLQVAQQQQMQVVQQQDDNMAVAQLTQELAAMKQTLNRALTSKKQQQPQQVNSSIDTGIMTHSMMMLEGGGEAERKESNSHSHSHSQRMKSVTFTPESLFHSPQAPTRGGGRGQRHYYGGISSSSYIAEEQSSLQQQQDDGNFEGGDDQRGEDDMLGSTLGSTMTLNMTDKTNARTAATAAALPPRYSQYEPLPSPAMMSASYPRLQQHQQQQRRQPASASSLSFMEFDQSMNNNNNNNSFSSQSLSALPRDQEELFEGIRDGGYHEGYWRAKYSVNMRR